MIVSASKYNKLADRFIDLRKAYEELIDKWNAQVDRINELGGEDFLVCGEAKTKDQVQFTRAELKELLKLIHPDKHQDSDKATAMTRRVVAQLNKSK